MMRISSDSPFRLDSVSIVVGEQAVIKWRISLYVGTHTEVRDHLCGKNSFHHH